ncbi:MAG: DNA-binding protein [Spirochaetales bacterium]|nr:DNA-binding protein [Spirochaetales bacterium]
MRYSEAKQGRVFVIRLEDGDVLHTSIEQFAKDKGIAAGALIALGGADKDSALIVGPEQGRTSPVKPMKLFLNDVHEISGTGTLFPDENGTPKLHMHIASGRKDLTVTGCVREGVKTWHIIEVILFELTESNARRVFDEETGFALLKP